MVWKIDPSGALTTVAGGGSTSVVQAPMPARSVQLVEPVGLAVDARGNVFIADSEQGRVVRVDPSGTLSPVAGGHGGDGIGDGGPATASILPSPRALTIDGRGNLLIADAFQHRVRKVDPAGIITTVAGTGVAGSGGDLGPATSAQLDAPAGVASDAAGNLYIADRAGRRVRVVNSLGIITTLAGTGTAGSASDGGPAALAQLTGPVAVATGQSGARYIADGGRVRKVDALGLITTVAGNLGNP